MFTIDLLKGQGIPERSGPERIVIAAVTFVVPIVVAIIFAGSYLSSKIAISVGKQEIAGYESKTASLSDALETQKWFERETSSIHSCLSEVAGSITRHAQWSAVLAAIAENMPETMVLTELEVKQDSVRKQVPKKDNPKQMVEVSVPVRMLQMSITGNPTYNCDKAVRDFKERLRTCPALGPKLDDIIVSQKFDRTKGTDVVLYNIDCVFKSGI
jgi:Tfp pilus assembly protein PilN